MKDFSDTQIEWLLSNIHQDDIEENERIKNVFDVLKPWLNLQLYQAEQKEKTQEKTTVTSDSFQEELRQHGASEDELKKIEAQVEKDLNG